jgi:tRNA/rRNA methyltransferase
VVLVAPRNPLNIGAAARAMSNFGCLNLRLVNPYEVAFREAKSAVKAQKVLENAREYATVGEAVADCGLVVGTTSIGHRALEHPLRRLEPGARLMKRKLASDLVALLFGSEKFGLSNDDMSHCNWLLRIPTRDEHASMNLGQAVAVCLYELIRTPSAAKVEAPARRDVSAGDLERMTATLKEVLEHSGYMHERVEGSSELKLRRMLRRMDLDAHDAQVWLGMLRQIRWKLLS